MQNQTPDNDNNTQALGRIMAICAWILAILLMGLFFNQWNKAGQKAKITSQNGVIETVVQRNYRNQYIVDGTINGKPVIFLLDTGATGIVVPENVAKQLGLKKGIPMEASTVGGTVTIYETRVDEIQIGHIVLKNLPATISQHLEDDEVLLGMTALRRVNFIQKDDSIILTTK